MCELFLRSHNKHSGSAAATCRCLPLPRMLASTTHGRRQSLWIKVIMLGWRHEWQHEQLSRQALRRTLQSGHKRLTGSQRLRQSTQKTWRQCISTAFSRTSTMSPRPDESTKRAQALARASLPGAAKCPQGDKGLHVLSTKCAGACTFADDHHINMRILLLCSAAERKGS